MSIWRRRALERLPQFKREIEGASSPMAMWIDLESACERALETRPPDLATADAIFAHALACLDSPNRDLLTAAALAFFENIVTCESARANLHRWLDAAAFTGLKHFFAYHLSPSELEALTQRFHAQRTASGSRLPKNRG